MQSRNQLGRDGETLSVRFEDAPALLAAFASWQAKREKWRAAELPARDAMAVFEILYALHGKIERESELFDVVIADGIRAGSGRKAASTIRFSHSVSSLNSIRRFLNSGSSTPMR